MGSRGSGAAGVPDVSGMPKAEGGMTYTGMNMPQNQMVMQSGDVQGSWASYQLRAIWRAEDNVLQLLCLPDIRLPEDKRAAMFEVLGLINEQLWLGHFDVWSNGSVLLYRHGLMLGDEGLLSLSQAQTLIDLLTNPGQHELRTRAGFRLERI